MLDIISSDLSERHTSEITVYCFRVTMTRLRFRVLPVNGNITVFVQSITIASNELFSPKTEDEHNLIYECPM